MRFCKIIGATILTTMMLFLEGCSKDAMPITANNVQEYFKATNEAANNMDASLSEVERMKVVAREPLENMGYDFDATLLASLKNINNSNEAKLALINEFSFVVDTVNKNPDESVKKGLVSEETKNKLLLFKKYTFSSKEELTKQMNMINLIRQCQSENNNICTAESFFNIMVKNGVEHLWNENDPTDIRASEVESTLMPILQNNIVKDVNGNIINSISELNTDFMITDKDYATLQKDLKDLWWIQ